MYTRVNIEIIGLSLCYLKDKIWNVVFICDDNHPLWFSYPGFAGPVAIRQKGRDLNFDFVCSRIVDNKASKGTGFSTLLNLSSDDAHGTNILGKPKLKQLRRNNRSIDLVWLKIHHATLGASNPSKAAYFIQEVRTVGTRAPIEQVGPVAQKVTISFDIEGSIRARAGDAIDDPISIPIPTPAGGGGTINLGFNNNCDGTCDHNDMLDIYDFLIDGKDGDDENRFVAGELDISGNVPGNSGKKTPVRDRNPDTGNCDPMSIDPPPNP